jgi:hypothetical protein
MGLWPRHRRVLRSRALHRPVVLSALPFVQSRGCGERGAGELSGMWAEMEVGVSEIAKCPICNGVPSKRQWIDMVDYVCCGIDCSGLKLWNQYAAAMELAKAHVVWSEENGNIHEFNRLNRASMRVLEVFCNE